VPLRVFCASLADVFDNEAPQEWRDDLWQLLRETPNLRWILLTKRIGNARKMLPADWPFPNAGLMATLANQEEWDRDWPKLEAIPATWRGVSAEPLLGPIDIGDARPDWIITGGESGPTRRPLDMDAVRSIRDQCAATASPSTTSRTAASAARTTAAWSMASSTSISRRRWQPECCIVGWGPTPEAAVADLIERSENET
jgi:protein gp37